jgi:hypothetical protein
MKELMEKVAGKRAKKVATKKVVAKKVSVSKKTATKKNALLASLVEAENIILTDNGAKAFRSTLNATLDLFAMGGALRTRGEQDIVNLFVKANGEDSLLALKCLFHIRNVRGGAGERRTFRVILKYLANNYAPMVKKNIGNIVHYGRFDDLYELFDTPCEGAAMEFMAANLRDDIEKMEKGEKISLSSKWVKSENASSPKTKALGSKFRKYLQVSERTFRKTLSALREYSEVLEVKLSNRDWKGIDYSKIPSKAGLLYRGAFKKHDPSGYQAFLDAVQRGEKTINASTLFPYEIVEKILRSGDNSQTVDALWNALPNYLEGNDRNILCVCDVSSSMSGRPMMVSISLGLYTAERNNGAFKNYFLTFHERPALQKVVGTNIREKARNLSRADWGGSTNLQSSFELILNHAIKNKAPAEDMPEQILIISDMEFNSACRGETNLKAIRAKYKAAGYECPNIVFWNVNSTKNNVAAKADDQGVILVSGCSPSVFRTLMSGKTVTPLDQMLETLNAPMYDLVKI